MKKLGMDVRMINHSGIGVRIQNILKHWENLEGWELYLFGDPNVLKNFSLPPFKEIIPYLVPVYSLREIYGHPQMKEMDVLDIPHFNAPLLYLSKCNITIHDLIPWVMREYHSSISKRLYLWIVLNAIFRFARKIFTVSEFTKNDIIRYFPAIKPELVVAKNGIDHNLYKKQTKLKIKGFKQKYNLPQEYFLTVGIGKGHKNQEFLWENMELIWIKDHNIPPLVLAGTGGKLPDYLEDKIKTNPSKIIILPRIPDEEMPLLYQSAGLLIYPSLYEGFGFPVVEASAVGTLVLSSNKTVLPEVLGDGGIFFDPHSVEDFQEKFNSAYSLTPQEKSKFLTKSIQKSKEFRWSSTVHTIQSHI